MGILAYKRFKSPSKLTLVESMTIAGLGWLIAAALGSIPYVLVLDMMPLDAFFEAMSSLTTTGMTMMPVLEVVPKSILFWRALGEWIGGAGIILLTTLFLLSREGIIAWRLYVAEAREEKLAPTMRETLRDVWLIYSFYTVLCAIILMFVGLEPFDAVCHSLTCISTGGFSTRTNNVGAFNSVVIEVVLLIFMVMGALRFSLHYKLFLGGLRHVVGDLEFKVFISILLVSSLIVSLDSAFTIGIRVEEAFRLGFFHTISIGTTAGFTTTDLSVFPPLSKVILLMLMVVGGCMNSTAGGIRVWRLIALLKIAKYEVEGVFMPPEAFRSLKINGRALRESEMVRVTSFFFIYILFAFIATSIVLYFEKDFLGSLSGVLSALANVGPFYSQPITFCPASKIVLIISMWVGRLELIPVILLFAPRLWAEWRRSMRVTS
ncbi:MAG: TrkH family potassium uptake protein [Candidatus Nezhaarchaeota archaeon]|nr:TrkH family potassium uptake protein [Candidatus Nezhaarchaeota archaeon]MCX8142297.1 TrkH family potassium uptake protein [Candidatus Nezhaarchaeota archaeon]MDW8050730.1 TrkH family potassium uptake protein [Nitrososphaerota archaeon]